MDTEIATAEIGTSDGLGLAIDRVEEIDEYRNLHDSIPILLFIASGGVAIRSFFWIIDFMSWVGINELVHAPVPPETMAFMLVFVVWILAFLIFMFFLECMKLKNVRMAITSQLSRLNLTKHEKLELRDIVNSVTWNNDRILKEVMAELVLSSR